VSALAAGYPFRERSGFHGLHGFVDEVDVAFAVDDSAMGIVRAGGFPDRPALAGEGGLEDEVAFAQRSLLP
jgi:hypothetical protein